MLNIVLDRDDKLILRASAATRWGGLATGLFGAGILAMFLFHKHINLEGLHHSAFEDPIPGIPIFAFGLLLFIAGISMACSRHETIFDRTHRKVTFNGAFFCFPTTKQFDFDVYEAVRINRGMSDDDTSFLLFLARKNQSWFVSMLQTADADKINTLAQKMSAILNIPVQVGGTVKDYPYVTTVQAIPDKLTQLRDAREKRRAQSQQQNEPRSRPGDR